MRDKAFLFEQAARARGELRRGRGDLRPEGLLIAALLLALYILGAAAGAWP